MYGEEQEDFGSDHYWNAVKVDGQWYYVDPCYTDVYTEVMSRDRVETDGDMNHVFFLFSDTSARKLYDGNMDIQHLVMDFGLCTEWQQQIKYYEKAWMARAASNVYYADGYACTTCMILQTCLTRVNSISSMRSSSGSRSDKKLQSTRSFVIRLTNKDIVSDKDADSDYETLINFHRQGKTTMMTKIQCCKQFSKTVKWRRDDTPDKTVCSSSWMNRAFIHLLDLTAALLYRW